ncbi:hypothetical protein SIAM614_31693 [Stappia aggregata IAM 12614]|uniref:Uncharacterized protein n=1 Tax=Roseibium aggregatum (strain ATCC 25650 / DSM 13394 / JCM 20685 / NBRC 16684 / NCIMB 2208 / IAM 12614 / B1) TaxID=384765 RepID=A0P4D5_ROSAI|nr:hypothetical protein SIAM614_31693 [Stappia aggregata IAM 12614] [Roseibium aggregatum IAM 12614]
MPNLLFMQRMKRGPRRLLKKRRQKGLLLKILRRKYFGIAIKR